MDESFCSLRKAVSNTNLKIFEDIEQKQQEKKRRGKSEVYLCQEDYKTMSVVQTISSNSQLEWETRCRIRKPVSQFIEHHHYETHSDHKKLCFCFVNNELEENYSASNIYWFIFDPNRTYRGKGYEQEETHTVLHPTIDAGQSLQLQISNGTYSYPCAFSCVSFNSSLYVIGGSYDLNKEPGGSSNVFVYDDYWSKHSNMLSPRCIPHVTVMCGKMFVFGTSPAECTPPKPWGECFDTQINQWIPIQDPPQKLSDCGVACAVPVGDASILFMSFNNELFSYGAIYGIWKQISSPLSYPWFWRPGGTCLDTILFFFVKGMVVAYDLAAEAWFEEEVKGLGICSTSSAPPQYLSLGYIFRVEHKLLCLVWSENDATFRCIKFSVSRVNNLLYADVKSRSNYRIMGDTRIQDCFLLS